MSLDEWAHACWFLLHELTQTSSDHMQAFVKLLPNILPCDTCSEHVVEEMRSLGDVPVAGLDEFVWRLHNCVNARLGKPAFPRASLGAAYGAAPLETVLHNVNVFFGYCVAFSSRANKISIARSILCVLLSVCERYQYKVSREASAALVGVVGSTSPSHTDAAFRHMWKRIQQDIVGYLHQ